MIKYFSLFRNLAPLVKAMSIYPSMQQLLFYILFLEFLPKSLFFLFSKVYLLCQQLSSSLVHGSSHSTNVFPFYNSPPFLISRERYYFPWTYAILLIEIHHFVHNLLLISILLPFHFTIFLVKVTLKMPYPLNVASSVVESYLCVTHNICLIYSKFSLGKGIGKHICDIFLAINTMFKYLLLALRLYVFLDENFDDDFIGTLQKS